jgi:formate dehydrogenase subunit gamma
MAVPPLAGSTEIIARIEELIADLRADDVDMLAAFHRIQHEYGYVPREAVPLLAARFNTTPAIVFGTIDFYSEVRTRAPAEDVVEWCSGPACLLKGSLGIQRALEAILECRMNVATADGKFELRLVQCDGTCHLAPLLRHKGRYIGPLSTSDAIEWARALKGIEPVDAADAVQEGADVTGEAAAGEAEGGEVVAEEAEGA